MGKYKPDVGKIIFQTCVSTKKCKEKEKKVKLLEWNGKAQWVSFCGSLMYLALKFSNAFMRNSR